MRLLEVRLEDLHRQEMNRIGLPEPEPRIAKPLLVTSADKLQQSVALAKPARPHGMTGGARTSVT